MSGATDHCPCDLMAYQEQLYFRVLCSRFDFKPEI